MAALRNIVLVGATGTVGSSVLQALLKDTYFNVTVLTRTESTSIPQESQLGFRVIRCEYTLPNFISSFQSQDAVVCAIPFRNLSIQELLLEAAEKAGVHRFVLDDYGNSPTNQIGLPELEPFRVPRRKMVELAKSLTATNNEFTWSALVTGNFVDYTLKHLPAFGFSIPERKARLVDDGTEPFTGVTVEDVGLAVVGILRNPTETANKILHIRSVQTSQKEILEALEDITDQRWEVEYADSDQMYEKGKAGMEKGDRAQAFDLVLVQLYAKGAGRSIVVSRQDADNDLLGIREKDIGTIVKNVMAE